MDEIPRPTVLPFGILRNTEEIYGIVASHPVVPLKIMKQLWSVYTVEQLKQMDPTTCRLENFWWHVWGSDRRHLSGETLSKMFRDISEGPTVVPLPPRLPTITRADIEAILPPMASELVKAHSHPGPPRSRARRKSKRSVRRGKVVPLQASAQRPAPLPPILKKQRGSSASGSRPTARFATLTASEDNTEKEGGSVSSGSSAATAVAAGTPPAADMSPKLLTKPIAMSAPQMPAPVSSSTRTAVLAQDVPEDTTVPSQSPTSSRSANRQLPNSTAPSKDERSSALSKSRTAAEQPQAMSDQQTAKAVDQGTTSRTKHTPQVRKLQRTPQPKQAFDEQISPKHEQEVLANEQLHAVQGHPQQSAQQDEQNKRQGQELASAPPQPLPKDRGPVLRRHSTQVEQRGQAERLVQTQRQAQTTKRLVHTPKLVQDPQLALDLQPLEIHRGFWPQHSTEARLQTENRDKAGTHKLVHDRRQTQVQGSASDTVETPRQLQMSSADGPTVYKQHGHMSVKAIGKQPEETVAITKSQSSPRRAVLEVAGRQVILQDYLPTEQQHPRRTPTVSRSHSGIVTPQIVGIGVLRIPDIGPFQHALYGHPFAVRRPSSDDQHSRSVGKAPPRGLRSETEVEVSSVEAWGCFDFQPFHATSPEALDWSDAVSRLNRPPSSSSVLDDLRFKPTPPAATQVIPMGASKSYLKFILEREKGNEFDLWPRWVRPRQGSRATL